MTTWSVGINEASPLSAVGGFTAELAKDAPSKGSFDADYNSQCLASGIVPCPFINSSGTEAVRVANCCLDLASWRACLLAASMVSSTVVELSLHSVSLTPQHLLDLSATMEKISNLQVLRLDYLTLTDVPAESSLASLLKPFVWGGTAAPVEYLSLQGNGLTDGNFCSDPAILTSLSGNFTLQALSLADNSGITDMGAAEILRAARLTVGLRELSLSKTSATFSGTLSEAIANLVSGSAANPDDEAAWKNAVKLIADRNKAVKDLNKKRKKSGYAELADLPVPPERIAKGGDGALYACNRALTTIDLSFCPLAPAEGHFAACLAQIRGPPKCPGAALALRLVLRGVPHAVVGAVDLEADGVVVVF